MISPRPGFLAHPDGLIAYAEAGSGDPVLLLHQTPRSWREYESVLPLLGRSHRAIAMDTPGYGDSQARSVDAVEAYAEVALQLLDALQIDTFAVAGHHTGGVIAMELAARAPERVTALILSCTGFMDAEGRAHPHVVDDFPVEHDGSHLVKLWQGRQRIYPAGRPELLTAFMIDALRAGERAADGHRAVRRYVAEDAIPHITAPTLLIGGTLDPAYPDLPRLSAAMPAAEVVTIEGGRCPLPDDMPEVFTDVVERFLATSVRLAQPR